jgi:hypothetical protein
MGYGRWYRGEVELDSDKLWKKSLTGDYWISEYGDVVNAETGYRLNPRAYKSGYVRVGQAVSKACGVHNAVYEAFVGEIPKGMQINHLDGNKANNHISNLELCTPKENVIHAYATGLAKVRYGEDVATSKVTEEDVLKMYGMFKLGYDNQTVGDMFGLHDRYVSLIRHGRRWKYLFEREAMTCTYSLGNLTHPLPRSVWIYNKCMTSTTPQDALAEELGIDTSTVSRIRTGKTWKRFREFFGVPASTDNWREIRNDLTVELKETL